MEHSALVAYALAKPGATEDEPWEGDIVAKVGGKIFAFLGGGGLGVKCGRDADGGPIPDDELIELVDASYAAVVAKLPKSKRPA